jgi:hypothetical protein
LEQNFTKEKTISYPLPNNVADSPRYYDVVVLISVKIKVFFHARDESIGDIGGINLRNGY